MEHIKRIVKEIFAAWGYKLVPSLPEIPETHILYNNFVSLAKAYEQRLNDLGDVGVISSDEMRIRLLSRLLGTPPAQAYYILQAMIKTRDIEGDVCEFGVAQGETSALIAHQIRNTTKKLHLFDSFQGLPRPTEKDKLLDDILCLKNIESYTGTMACPEDLVIARLDAIAFPENRYVIHKGFIEELIRLDKQFPTRVSFAYVDFDFYEPTKIALEYLDAVTPPNAIIIVDDYNRFSEGAKIAVDEFIEEKPLYRVHTPKHVFGYFVVLTKLDSRPVGRINCREAS